MITREATKSDWQKLHAFFIKIYRKDHPLHNFEFWDWQFGNPNNGRSFICLNEQNEIVGHVGANFGGNIAWIINVFLDEECRGKGILGQLYALARKYHPLAATAANEAGLGLYRNMRWIRYYNLVRFVKINPLITDITTENVCKPIRIDVQNLIVNDTHYFNQPTIKAIKLIGGSTALSQENVGGLRMVDIEDVKETENHAWQLGYNWIDYVTSWNDLKIKNIEANGWLADFKSVVPWRLNPIQKNYFCNVSFLSEIPLSKEFVVHRSYSDHGRVGSIKINEV